MRAKGFTLIELLVVVAIIAVLVAILLPALSRAREQARTTLCLSQVKSQASAVLLYEMDYGVFPPVYWGRWQAPYDRSSWAHFIYSYLAGGAKTYVMVDYAWWHGGNAVSVLPTFICPSATTSCIVFCHPAGSQVFGPNYAYADLIHQIPNDAASEIDTYWLRSSELTQPGQVRMICDSDTYFTHYCPPCGAEGWQFPDLYDTPAFGRHMNGLNVGFWDGHGQFMTNSDVESDPVLHGHCGL